MTGVVQFISDPKVHDTALVIMGVSSFMNALPKPGTVKKFSWGLVYALLYEWAVGFWSMKTGHTVPENPTLPDEPAKK